MSAHRNASTFCRQLHSGCRSGGEKPMTIPSGTRRALLVEPFGELRDMLAAMLRRDDFVVDVADDWFDVAPDARKSYAVVVADVPFDESPATVERRIIERTPEVASHLVLMSAGESAADSTAEVLMKPFDRERFVLAIRRAVSST